MPPTQWWSDVPLELSGDQRARLVRVKLAGLVRDLTGRDADPQTLGPGAAAVEGSTAYVFSTAGPASLAGAMDWAQCRGAERLVLFVDDPAGTTARLATYFTLPVDVRSVQGAGSVSAAPDPWPEQPEPPPASVGQDELIRELLAAGLEVVTEDGIVRGEVLGLEVCRLVHWPVDVGGDGLVHLEAGVGRFDRDATAAMHQGERPAVTLARAVSMVREHRRPGAGAHPMAIMARERWLRAALVQDPSLVGAGELAPVETTVVRDSVRRSSPAAAAGVDGAGRPLLVVCSTGVDLSLVPVAADTRAWRDPSARLVLVIPARDRVPTQVRLTELLEHGAELVTVAEPWAAP